MPEFERGVEERSGGFEDGILGAFLDTGEQHGIGKERSSSGARGFMHRNWRG